MKVRTVVHSAYEWGRLTEGWIRDQAVPVGPFGVQVVCARTHGPSEGVVRSTEAEASLGQKTLDRAIARITGRRWAPAYLPLIEHQSAAVLHAHFGDWGYGMSPVAAKLHVPLIVSFYGYDAGRLPRERLWSQRIARLFAEAACVLAEGPAMAERLQKIGCPADRVRVVPLAIDLRDWPPPRVGAGMRGRNGCLHLVIASSLREKKGVETALRGIAMAASSMGQPWRLTIVGDGPLRSQLEAEAHRLRIAPRIEWLGYRAQDELRAILRTADLLLQTSHTASDGDTEGGAPVVLLQAAAAGVPVIGTDHADISFVVEDGLTGWLAPERDPSAVADLLSSVVAGDQLPRAGRNARQRAQQRFDLPRLHGTLAAVYTEVAG